jgi:serine protease inhibitor
MANFSQNYPILNVDADQCSYPLTSKNYHYQPWARCFDCFNDDEGACIACLKKCHSGHNLGDIQYNPFYCDCGCTNNCTFNHISKQKNNIPIDNSVDTNKLGWKLFDILDKNTVHSPLSVGYILSMLHLGSVQNTEKQLTNLLGRKANIYELITKYYCFNNDIIKLINAFIINDTFPIKQSYYDQLDPIALIYHENFNNPDKIVKHINKYIETNTDGIIKNIIPPESINTDTILALINILYLKMEWAKPFKSKFTKSEPFGKKMVLNQTVQMMTQTDFFPYYENGEVQILQMPYYNMDYTMGFILPKEDEIILTNLSKIISNDFSTTQVEVHIPKFTHRTKLDLTTVLQKIGLGDIFVQCARFDEISDHGLYISLMIHEAIVIVDENESSIPTNPSITVSNPIIFYANRPFIYYIKHMPTDTILFIGNYEGPV